MTDDGETADLAALRRMTPAEKLAVMDALWHQAWALARAGMRDRHPDWSAEAIDDAVRSLFGRAPA